MQHLSMGCRMMIHKPTLEQDLASDKPTLVEFAAAFCCLVGFFAYKYLAQMLLGDSLVAVWVPFSVLAVCIVFPGLPSASVSPALRIVCRVVAVMLGFYAYAATITYPSGVSAEADTVLAIARFIPLAAITAAVLTFLYPAFVIVPATAVLAKKAIGANLFEIRISHTDYLAVVEMGLLLGIACIVLARGGRIRSAKPTQMLFRCNQQVATVIVFMIGIAAHFSNYFFSGFQKIMLDGGPLFWVFQNPTHVLSINAWLSGSFPFGPWQETAKLVIELADQSHVLLNIIILLAQLAAVVFIARRVTMIGLTLFYDLTHIIIFLVSGIFFWKWIILNLALVAAVHRLPKWVEKRSVVAVCIAVVLFAPAIFGIVRLGWYDTRALVISEAFAVTNSGEVIRVPSNYFGTISITAAQHRLGRYEKGHFPTVTWGSTQTVDDFEHAIDGCSFDIETRQHFRRTSEQISKTIRLTHLYALQRETLAGRYNYDLFPHHVWSNPLLYRDFAAIAAHDIEHYIYRTRSGCTSLSDDGPLYEEHKSTEFIVPLPDGL